MDAKKAIATGRDPETLGLLGAEGLWVPRTQGGSRGLPGGAEEIRTSDLRSAVSRAQPPVRRRLVGDVGGQLEPYLGQRRLQRRGCQSAHKTDPRSASKIDPLSCGNEDDELFADGSEADQLASASNGATILLKPSRRCGG